MVMYDESFQEKINLNNYKKRLLDLSWMISNVDDEDRYAKDIPMGATIENVMDFNMDEYGRVWGKVREIHSPEFRGHRIKHFKELKLKKQRSKAIDWTLLTKHIIKRRDYFVTLNTRDFINNNRKEKFEKEFEEYDLQIRELNHEFIKELKTK